MNGHPPSFAIVLREKRLAAGLTQAELAERAKVSDATVSNLERGIGRRPNVGTVRRLADALGLAGDDRERFLATGLAIGAAAAPPQVAALSSAAATTIPAAPAVSHQSLTWAAVVVGAALLLGVLAWVQPWRSATPGVTCTGRSCNGLDPGTTGCSARSSTVAKADVPTTSGQTVGWVDLRWSELCQTNWARIQNETGDEQLVLRVFLRDASGALLEPTRFELKQGKGAYGNMWYAPTGVVAVRACGTIGPHAEVCTALR